MDKNEVKRAAYEALRFEQIQKLRTALSLSRVHPHWAGGIDKAQVVLEAEKLVGDLQSTINLLLSCEDELAKIPAPKSPEKENPPCQTTFAPLAGKHGPASS